MSVTATVRGTITLTDNLTGSIALSKTLNNAFTGTLSSFGQSIVIGTSPYTVNLPNGVAQFIYIRNLSSTAGTTITITWTPNGGVSASIIVLDAQATVILAEATTTDGVSALSMVSNQSGTLVEFILAG